MIEAAQNTDLWRRHLSNEGEEELDQLLFLLENDPEHFSLLIVRSDFDTQTRDALLQEVAREMSPVPLHTLALSREDYDVPLLLSRDQSAFDEAVVFVVIGLEETPNLSDELNNKMARPPALAILNHGRETIRRIGRPILLWCDPLAYGALREHAPDFFDHYTGLFTFLDAAPAPFSIAPPTFDPNIMFGDRPRLLSALSPRATSPTARQFYKDQLETLRNPTPERARALLGLADTLFSAPLLMRDLGAIVEAENAVREAIEILEKEGSSPSSARAHGMLAVLLKRKYESSGIPNPIYQPEVQEHIAEALEVFNERDFPIEWASLMWTQASPAESGEQDENTLRRAIPFYQATQRVFTLQSQPYFWANCEMNLGNVYASLPYSPRNFKRAIEHLQSALRVLTERAYPQEHSLAQLQLGKAYSVAAEHAKDKNEGAKLIRRAIECYERAWHAGEKTNMMESVALPLTLLAMNWHNLPTGNRRQNLRRSANYWLRAARLLTHSSESKHDSQGGLHFYEAGKTLLELAHLSNNSVELIEARGAFRSAWDIFRSLGDAQAENARESADAVCQIEDVLKKAAAQAATS